MKRVLVAGFTGFIGSRLVEELGNKGYDITVISRGTNIQNPKNYYSLILSDLSTANNNFGQFDVVVNCASVITGEDSWDFYSKNNCSSVQNLIDQVDCEKFIHISSCSIFSENSYFHAQPSPVDYYGLSKYVGEKILEFHSKKFFSSFILRFPIVLGYGKKTNDVIKYIYEMAEKNEDIELFGNGQYYRNIIHVSEVVSAIIKTIEKQEIEEFHSINVGSSNSLKLLELCNIILDRTGSSAKTILSKKIGNNNFNSFLDVSKCSEVNYNCLTAEDNLIKYLKEMELHEI